MPSYPDPAIWDKILAHLRTHNPDMCRQWFEQIEVLDFSGGVLRLSINSPLYLRYLQRECRERFSEAAQAVTGRLVTVLFVGEEGLDASFAPGERNGAENTSAPTSSPHAHNSTLHGQIPPTFTGSGSAPKPIPLNNPLPPGDSSWGMIYDEMVINPDYSFENFVEGPSNRLAYHGARGVADHPGTTAYNPFFIHGSVGLGKTHLLQAICQILLRDRPDCRIFYISCEGFVRQFMQAVQAGLMDQFRHRFRDIDALIIDDIHFLGDHERTQEEFFHTFNSLYESRKQIVLSSDAAPDEIPKLEKRLVSRFGSGLVAPIDRPCYETRLAILHKKAQLRGLPLPDEVLSFVASNLDSNIRELEGALTKLQAMALATGTTIDLDLAQGALGRLSDQAKIVVRIEDVVAAVSRRFDVRQSDLFSKKRHKSIAWPRQVAMYLARHHTGRSLQEIGGNFGGRDHTTVMHAVAKVHRHREEEPAFARQIESIERELVGRPM